MSPVGGKHFSIESERNSESNAGAVGVCDCGAEVTTEDGPTHPYMRCLPACWRMYAELGARLASQAGHDSAHVDCFAAQHPGGADTDRRQRQSVAIHLVALCCHLEHRVARKSLHRFRGHVSARVLPAAGLSDWPFLQPPTAQLDGLTAPQLSMMNDAELPIALRDWPSQVWENWSMHHHTIRTWSEHVLTRRDPRRG